MIGKIAIILSIFTIAYADNCGKRPIDVIVKGLNSVAVLKANLNGKFNAIQIPVTFNSQYEPSLVYQPPPGDCYVNASTKENWSKYIDTLRKLGESDNAEYREELVTVYLDLVILRLCNEEKFLAGSNLAKSLNDMLYLNGKGNTQLRVVIRINSLDDLSVIRGAIDYVRNSNLSFAAMEKLEKNIAWNIISEGDLFTQQYRAFDQFGVKNIVYSSGRSNCYDVKYQNAKLQIAVRDHYIDVNDFVVNIVIMDDINTQTDIENVLKIRVDGFTTDNPETAWEVINSDRFKHEFELRKPNQESNKKYYLLENPHENKPDQRPATIHGSKGY